MARFLRFTLLLIAFLSIFPLYTRYKAAAAPIPPGVHLASLELSHLKDPAEIEAAIAAGLREPIAVYYDKTRLVLRPQDVDFQIDAAAMLAEAQQYLSGPDFVDIALRKIGRDPPAPQRCFGALHLRRAEAGRLAVAGGRKAGSSTPAGPGSAAAVGLEDGGGGPAAACRRSCQPL